MKHVIHGSWTYFFSKFLWSQVNGLCITKQNNILFWGFEVSNREFNECFVSSLHSIYYNCSGCVKTLWQKRCFWYKDVRMQATFTPLNFVNLFVYFPLYPSLSRGWVGWGCCVHKNFFFKCTIEAVKCCSASIHPFNFHIRYGMCVPVCIFLELPLRQ